MEATARALSAPPSSDFDQSRENYQRFAFLLFRRGRVPGLALSHIDFRLLAFLLGQKPGSYYAHHSTIAEAVETNVTTLRASLARLRVEGLVWSDHVSPHHRLPSTGRYTRTNVCGYRVNLARLAALLERPSILPKSSASTLPKSDASYGTIQDLNASPPSPPKPEAPEPQSAQAPKGEEGAVINSDLDAEIAEPEATSQEPLVAVPEDLAPICAAWEATGLSAIEPRSVRALRNRVLAGATLEQLAAAVEGAAADEWLRKRAHAPFAVVFANLASVERFAHEGRKIRDAREHMAKRDVEDLRSEIEWRCSKNKPKPAEPPRPTSADLSWLLGDSMRPAQQTRPLTQEEIVRKRDAMTEIGRLMEQGHEEEAMKLYSLFHVKL
jgi:hypothetical protein